MADDLSRDALAGGNIVQFAAVAAINCASEVLKVEDCLQAIRHEMDKEGKVFTELPDAF